MSYSAATAPRLPYARDLRAIRKVLDRNLGHTVGFPEAWCTAISGLLARECGFSYKEGLYLPDGREHAWNRDERRQADIDLTHDQFDPKSPVLVLPVPNAVLGEYSESPRPRSGRADEADLERIIASRASSLDPHTQGAYSEKDARMLYGRIMRGIKGPAARIRRYLEMGDDAHRAARRRASSDGAQNLSLF